MIRMKVKMDGLNLRSTPEMLPDNIIGSMPLAHEVKVIDAPAGQRFWEVETLLNGQVRRGFAVWRFLRQPLSSAKEKMMKNAVEEWIVFNRIVGRECVNPFS